MRHRVIPNAATERWCSRRSVGPSAVVLAGRATAPLGRLAPLGAMGAIAALQRPWLPLFTPALPLAGMPESTLECSAMYAGESALRVNQALPAERVLAELAPA
jgi:hypothetical protein